MLRSYLRARIKKIEEFTLYYLKDGREKLMTPSEQAYAKRFLEIEHDHFRSSVLDELPDQLRALDSQTEEINMVPAPNEKGHVFIRVKENVGSFLVEDPLTEEDTEIPLEQDNVLMIPYNTVQQLVES